ncbi:SIMPL domain-containing protein [Vibrio ishigakensis]|uniref:SIMPL domain-containing protein n=1 Tax=Vibrio ishigakensis TaxID=1481914 RepID=UPI0021C4306A|nr:SIMPL domain-containing protein [Vibrio ishigakensis]
MKWIKTLLLGGMACLPLQMAQAQSFDFPHLITTGQGEVTATPDKADVALQVVINDESAESAKQQADKVVAQLRKALNDLGISEASIQSGNLNIAPQIHYPKNGTPETKGYRANRRINVEITNLAILPKVLEASLKAGVNRVDSVRLGVQDADMYQSKARQAAVKDAQAKAKALAQDFGEDLGNVWQIQYQSSSASPVMRAMSMDEAKESSGYVDSTITIRDRVSVVYKLD